MGLRDPIVAYCFDRAVSVFGRIVEADVEKFKASRKGERAQAMAASMRMSVWLQTTPQLAQPPVFS